MFGLPDQKWVEAVSAVAVLRVGAEATTDELRRHCAQHLAGFKVPSKIEIRHEPLPRNANGKILKRQLKQEMERYGTP